MDAGLTLLRTFGVLVFCLGLGLSLHISHVGRAAALAAARAGAVAVADTLPRNWDCAFADDKAAAAHRTAAAAVVARLAQLAAVTPTDVSVAVDPACALVVSVTVSASSWLPTPRSTAVMCHRRATAATAAVDALVAC
ncbi:MAG TPA: hypothetical protein DEP66_01090 [Acidimicrobiaceae bacterium]|nr:hypothetical protein [Acidimicrobiaceae bacterium]HCB36834.1 hypothetical protein [Acidimicrobiaceae bacterium]